MGNVRKDSPKPWTQRQARTVFLRVPAQDWAAVKIGSKTEFRMPGGRAMSQLWSVKPPTPVVAYAIIGGGRYVSSLMVLERHWREPVGGLTPESIAAEGFPDMAHFRRYWMARTKRRFRPLQEVWAYRVRPFRAEDRTMLGEYLFDRLYGEHLAA
jgi:hypothetical protein